MGCDPEGKVGWHIAFFVLLGFLIVSGLIFTATSLAGTVASSTYDSLLNSTVMIANKDGGGAGVVVGHNLVLTAKHVVFDKKGHFVDDMEVIDIHGDKYKQELAWTPLVGDLALLHVELHNDMKPVAISCDLPKAGDAVVMVGHPRFSIKWGLAFGHVSSNFLNGGEVPLDITMIPGDSGGPLVNERGELVGIAVSVLAFPTPIGDVQLTGYSFMVPISDLCKVIPRIDNGAPPYGPAAYKYSDPQFASPH